MIYGRWIQLLSVDDNLAARTAVLRMLFLLDDAKHQRYQPHAPDKHQHHHQQLAVTAQQRGDVQAGPDRADGRDALESDSQQRQVGLQHTDDEHEDEEHPERHHHRGIGAPDGVVGELAPEHLHPLRPAQYGHQVEHHHGEGIDLDAARRGLRTAANPHQHEVEQQGLHAQSGQIDAGKARRTGAHRIEERLRPLVGHRHPCESGIPLEKGDARRTCRQQQERHNQRDARIQVVEMVETAAVPLSPSQETPAAAYVIAHDVLEVHQYRESDAAKDNQRRDIQIERIMPRHQQRIAQVARQGGKARVAEGRYGVESRESQLLAQPHAHRAMDIAPDGEHTHSLYHQCKAEDIDQRGEQRIQRIGTDHVAHHQPVVQGGVAHKEHREKARQRHHSQTANLNQEENDHKARRRKGGGHVHRGQPRHTHRAGGDEQRVHPRDARHRRAGKHQQSRPDEYNDKKADRQDERGVRPPSQQAHQPIRQVHEGERQQQYEMIHLAVQDVPHSLNGAFHLRTVKDDRNQRQVKQRSQHPRQPAERLSRIFIFQHDMQGYVGQKNNPHPVIQALQPMSLSGRDCESMLIHQSGNQQDGRQVGQERHSPQRHTYIRMNPFILIQQKFVINLHKYIH